jgi:pimeloyl-ACP methyl ester carboxylesterase
LLREGHTADAVTLFGLDPDGPAAPGANLDTHINEVLELLASRDERVVLVGHSYAGSVITAVADQRPEQVSALLYLDAFVPEDGDSCWSMVKEWEREWYIDGSRPTGVAVEPLPFFDGRARPHPIGTLLQRSTVTGAYKSVQRKHYVLAGAPEWREQSSFVELAERLREQPDWTVIESESTHNFLKNGPDELLRLILVLA